ncbi:MAG: phytanoyl-CoA dioxygenase family protein [Nitrococcus sp.]|nr:phytanoyl-CoA dioxygenase family protein [Nitrococcus sp.]
MLLSTERHKEYERDGYVVVADAFFPHELNLIRQRIGELSKVDDESRVLERDGRTIRALHGCDQRDALLARLVCHPSLLEPAQQVIGGEVYTYQFKVNTKAAFRGDVWPWHQDYAFWKNEDGMPEPRAVSAMLFLDDVTEFNGPLYFMTGSHREGCIPQSHLDGGDHDRWRSDVSADLTYQLSEQQMLDLTSRYELAAPKGAAGSVVFFAPNLVHGSPSNISASSRRVLIVTYNALDNIPKPSEHPRPEFLVARPSGALAVIPREVCFAVLP